MTTTQLKAFGLNIELEESVIANGFVLIEQYRIENATPTECMIRLGKELGITGMAATAIYAEYASRNKPLF